MEALRPAEAAAQRALADAGLHLKPGWICEVPVPPPPRWSAWHDALPRARATCAGARPAGGGRTRDASARARDGADAGRERSRTRRRPRASARLIRRRAGASRPRPRRPLSPPVRWQALRAAPDGRTAGLAPEERAYQLALYSDLREAGTGCLPPGIEGFDNRTVEGKFVLQVVPRRRATARAPRRAPPAARAAAWAVASSPGVHAARLTLHCVFQVDEIVDVSQVGEHRHGIINNRCGVALQLPRGRMQAAWSDLAWSVTGLSKCC